MTLASLCPQRRSSTRGAVKCLKPPPSAEAARVAACVAASVLDTAYPGLHPFTKPAVHEDQQGPACFNHATMAMAVCTSGAIHVTVEMSGVRMSNGLVAQARH